MRESKAQLEEADQKRNCPSLVEKVTFKAKIMKQTNNKTLTIHVAIFTLLLMLINTNIVQISQITSYWHKNPSFFPIKYPCNISTKYPCSISTKYPCSKSCTNMLLHQSHIMFYVSTNPPKIHVSILQYKFMYHSHIIFYLPTNPKKNMFLPFNTPATKYVSIHPTNMLFYPSHKYVLIPQICLYISIPQICMCVSILHKYVPFTYSH